MNYDIYVPLHDADYVRFQVFLERRLDLAIVYQQPLDYHTCTQEDFDTFYTISRDN